MQADLQTYITFFLTGKIRNSHLEPLQDQGLHPALFSNYRDLPGLRYDFPLVLARGSGTVAVKSLSGLIDDLIANMQDERLGKHALRLEQAIRQHVAEHGGGPFSKLFTQAEKNLVKADKDISNSLERLGESLSLEADVVDCDAAMPYRLIEHIWSATQKQRAGQLGKDIKRLILKLFDIIQADFAGSNAGKSAENLKATFASGPMDQFDFKAMSRFLTKAAPKEILSKARRERIQGLLTTLQTQKFFPIQGADAKHVPYSFTFESCTAAVKTYRERLPKMIELARAVAIAELEIKNEYNEAKHNSLFESFGANGLDANETELFPVYLLKLNVQKISDTELTTLVDILTAGLPFKVLLQTDDLIEESAIDKSLTALAHRSRNLVSTAMGLNDVFVMQTTASSLYQDRGYLQKGLEYNGPAIFSVFSGATAQMGDIPPYLVSAMALEARLFPAFVFDPSAGSELACRFSMTSNPQRCSDWPQYDFSYEDEKCQRIEQKIGFSLIDFVACDTRYQQHFALAKDKQKEAMLPAQAMLDQPWHVTLDKVPYIMMVDAKNRLYKVIVDESVLRQSKRCLAMWKSLQELGGINNSFANRLLAEEKGEWEAEMARLKAEQQWAQPIMTASAQTTPPTAMTQATEIAVAAATVLEPEPSSDEAYIETFRCASCNECIQINDKMFVYNGDKQAYIADINAGTYAQLVEAAENCQVAVIHPGKPKNPNEAGIEELLKRAEPFM